MSYPVPKIINVFLFDGKSLLALLVFVHEKQWSTDATGISVNVNFLLSNVTEDRHLRHHNVHGSPQVVHGTDELVGVTMDTHPCAVYEHLCGAVGG